MRDILLFLPIAKKYYPISNIDVGPSSLHSLQIEVQNAIEMAIRIWLPLSLGNGGLGAGIAPGWANIEAAEQPLEWPDGMSINGIIKKMFYPPDETFKVFNVDNNENENGLKYVIRRHRLSEASNAEFEILFNLRDILRLTGFKVIWTKNLFDHLLVRKFSGQNEYEGHVYIYHDTGFLNRLRGEYVVHKIMVSSANKASQRTIRRQRWRVSRRNPKDACTAYSARE